MKAEIISVGTELLLGEIIDTNSAYLAAQLPLLGLDLHFISTVGDNQERLVETLKQAWQRAEIIITTGGLGPTQDDVTREAISSFLHEEITIDRTLVHKFRQLFRYYKIEMPQSNMKQAATIPSAEIIQNPRGTAPGWWVERDNRIIVTMPGPPREMEYMWKNEIFPRLQRKMESAVIVSKTLKLFGLTEADVDERASPFLSDKNPTLATYAKSDGVYLRMTAKAPQRAKAQELLAQRETDLRLILNDYIWGTDADTLESVVGDLLTKKGLSISTMESFSGGLLSNAITNAPQSSKHFKGGIIACADGTESIVGFDLQPVSGYDTVSAEVAEAMATLARRKLGADIGVGLTGITASTEIEGRAVGTIFIGFDDGRRICSYSRCYPGNLQQFKQRAVTSTLFELRRFLL